MSPEEMVLYMYEAAGRLRAIARDINTTRVGPTMLPAEAITIMAVMQARHPAITGPLAVRRDRGTRRHLQDTGHRIRPPIQRVVKRPLPTRRRHLPIRLVDELHPPPDGSRFLDHFALLIPRAPAPPRSHRAQLEGVISQLTG
jgi:hypothetical protein